jgi:hypothetical protein
MYIYICSTCFCLCDYFKVLVYYLTESCCGIGQRSTCFCPCDWLIILQRAVVGLATHPHVSVLVIGLLFYRELLWDWPEIHMFLSLWLVDYFTESCGGIGQRPKGRGIRIQHKDELYDVLWLDVSLTTQIIMKRPKRFVCAIFYGLLTNDRMAHCFCHFHLLKTLTELKTLGL